MNIYDYKDVVLIPKMGIVDSRSECSTKVEFGGYQFKLPVVPANMESVINEDLAIKLAQNGYFYIMHRFGVDNIEFVRKMKSLGLVSSISIGVNEDSYNQIDKLISENLVPDFITIDIAHGYSIKMKRMLEFIKSKNIRTFVIAGNICTEDAAEDLTLWGADCIKAGIAPGEACFIDGTQILTKGGYQKIEDIRVGDFVLTHTLSWKEVINKISYISEEKFIEINGEVCTEDHEFYVIEIKNLERVDESNYKDFCFFLKAKDINPELHKIVSVDM